MLISLTAGPVARKGRLSLSASGAARKVYSFGTSGRPEIRRKVEDAEDRLSRYAAKARHTRGRERQEPECAIRTAFQRDRDRIIHTNAFRRLKHKTQVFIAPMGDHFVTRLTHTLEVSQIARTAARALALNEDLVEAISLGHDLGHTPFGHVGEETMDQMVQGGFSHAQQSVRIVEKLERGGQGLNLTYEVRQGILNHSKPRGDFLTLDVPDLTLEAQLCRVCDVVAYLNHDVADAVRAGILREDTLPEAVRKTLGETHSQRIDTMVWDIVEASWPARGRVPMPKGERPVITMSDRVYEAVMALREFMFRWVYEPAGQGREAKVARDVMRLLFDYFRRNPRTMPDMFIRSDEPLERCVVDYISGMTDRFAIMVAERIRPNMTEGVFRWTI